MKLYLALISMLALVASCGPTEQSMNADQNLSSGAQADPMTRRGDHIDTYFTTDVPDPYRWLEDDLSDDTSAWISQQNTSTRSFIDAISLRDDVKKTVARLLNFERETAPFLRVGRAIFTETQVCRISACSFVRLRIGRAGISRPEYIQRRWHGQHVRGQFF